VAPGGRERDGEREQVDRGPAWDHGFSR
jgi:hypothetical protein